MPRQSRCTGECELAIQAPLDLHFAQPASLPPPDGPPGRGEQWRKRRRLLHDPVFFEVLLRLVSGKEFTALLARDGLIDVPPAGLVRLVPMPPVLTEAACGELTKLTLE